MSQPSTQYCCIGKGFCGSIWTLEDTRTNNTQQTVIKREDGGPGRSVANDHTMHLQLLQSAVHYSLSLPLSIPKCHELIQNIDSWWESRLPQFPPGYSACRALISERIPKVPRSISDKIVDLFCAGNTPLADFVKSNPDDDACLIRPYLGRRRRHRQEGASQSRFQRFSLRNVPLHVDQMEVLGLDVNAYAETMAEGLAPMYWGAGIDANDVEFVLAPPRKDAYSSTFQSEYLGVHCMWILDFDCCRPMQMVSSRRARRSSRMIHFIRGQGLGRQRMRSCGMCSSKDFYWLVKESWGMRARIRGIWQICWSRGLRRRES
jgi:hypothetical protein